MADYDPGWASPRLPHTGVGKPRTLHGELYLFGSLAIVAIGARLIIAHTSWTYSEIRIAGRSP